MTFAGHFSGELQSNIDLAVSSWVPPHFSSWDLTNCVHCEDRKLAFQFFLLPDEVMIHFGYRIKCWNTCNHLLHSELYTFLDHPGIHKEIVLPASWLNRQTLDELVNFLNDYLPSIIHEATIVQLKTRNYHSKLCNDWLHKKSNSMFMDYGLHPMVEYPGLKDVWLSINCVMHSPVWEDGDRVMCNVVGVGSNPGKRKERKLDKDERGKHLSACDFAEGYVWGRR